MACYSCTLYFEIDQRGSTADPQPLVPQPLWTAILFINNVPFPLSYQPEKIFTRHYSAGTSSQVPSRADAPLILTPRVQPSSDNNKPWTPSHSPKRTTSAPPEWLPQSPSTTTTSSSPQTSKNATRPSLSRPHTAASPPAPHQAQSPASSSAASAASC